jgi:hypothetical protein
VAVRAHDGVEGDAGEARAREEDDVEAVLLLLGRAAVALDACGGKGEESEKKRGASVSIADSARAAADSSATAT